MKKVLIITYYWPPAGGPGVQRVLKFAKYLPEFGWQPIILTVKNGEYPAIDESLTKEVPEGIKVHKTRTFEPFLFYKFIIGKGKNYRLTTHTLDTAENSSLGDKISRWIRANLFIPDARIGWLPFAVKKGVSIIRKENIDLLLSSSPPQTVHMIADKIARKTKVKWVTDFRDPWTDYFRIKDLRRLGIMKKLDRLYEKRVLRHSNTIITSSDSLAELLSTKVKNNYVTITNGYDEDDFLNAKKNESDKFRIIYTGNVSESQNPVNLFSAVKNLSDTIKKRIDISFYGNVHPKVISTVKQMDLYKIISFNSYIPHSEVITKIMSADILLLLIPQFEINKNIIPGKIFEYLAAHKPIMGIGNPKGDSAEILNKSKLGKMYSYDLTSWGNVILEYFENWEKGMLPSPDLTYINQFLRKKLTQKLSEIFNRIS